MAAKKKTNTSTSMEANASTEARPSTDNTIVTTTNDHNTSNHEDNGEDASVDDLTEGEFKVDLLDMGIASEDIQAMRRTYAHLAERLHHAKQATTQADTSNAVVTTRSKGKEHELTAQELEEQLNKLREEELCYKAMRQAIRDRMAKL